jgi:hypothetical protein
MIYKKFLIEGSYPFGSPIKVWAPGASYAKEFPFRTTDEFICRWIDKEIEKRGLK